MSSNNINNFKPSPETVEKLKDTVTKLNYGRHKIKKSVNQLPTQTKVAIIVCGIIIIFFMFYYLIYKKSSKTIHTTFLNELDKSEEPHNAKNTYNWKHKGSSKPYIPLSQLGIGGNEYTVSFWIYPIGSRVTYIDNINDWSYNYGKWKHILHIGTPIEGDGPPKFQSPGFWLSPKLNRLNVMFDTLSIESKERVVIDNLDLNSWTNVTAVLDNTSVDIYLNGRLEKTITIRYNLEKLNNTNNMYICKNGGFAGFLSYVQTFETPLEPDEVHNIYKKFKNKIDKWYYSKMDQQNIPSPVPIDINCRKGKGGGKGPRPGPGPGPGSNTYGCVNGQCIEGEGTLTEEECNNTCGKPGANTYGCVGEKCIEGKGNLTIDECNEICKNPCD